MANNINCDAKQMESVFFDSSQRKCKEQKSKDICMMLILVHLPHCVYATWFILNFS